MKLRLVVLTNRHVGARAELATRLSRRSWRERPRVAVGERGWVDGALLALSGRDAPKRIVGAPRDGVRQRETSDTRLWLVDPAAHVGSESPPLRRPGGASGPVGAPGIDAPDVDVDVSPQDRQRGPEQAERQHQANQRVENRRPSSLRIGRAPPVLCSCRAKALILGLFGRSGAPVWPLE